MKISPNDYTIFCEQYFSGDYPSERFGQAFFNEFIRYSKDLVEEENLFNETSTKRAQEIIWKHYIYTEFDYQKDLKELGIKDNLNDNSREVDKDFIRHLKGLMEMDDGVVQEGSGEGNSEAV